MKVFATALCLLPLAVGATEYGSPDRLFGHWIAACEKTQPGPVRCSARFRDLSVNVTSESTYSIFLRSPLHSHGSIEIDDKSHFYDPRERLWISKDAERLVVALARAKKAALSYTNSYGTPVFYDIELVGYRQALEYMLAEVTSAARSASSSRKN